MSPLYSISGYENTPPELNNIIFDFAGANNFYAINWVCRQWQMNLTEEKVVLVSKNLFAHLISVKEFDCEKIALLLDPKSKKNGILKILSLPAFFNFNDNLEFRHSKALFHKISLKYIHYELWFEFAWGNKLFEFNNNMLTIVSKFKILRSYEKCKPSYVLGMIRDFYDFPNLINDTNGTLSMQKKIDRMLPFIGSQITPEFNRDPEYIVSFKDFFSTRVYRIDQQSLM